tara:strand:+ start:267 stop:461 length:195 start_codon:yes stop_codon:yes gene_type:complete
VAVVVACQIIVVALVALAQQIKVLLVVDLIHRTVAAEVVALLKLAKRRLAAMTVVTVVTEFRQA